MQYLLIREDEQKRIRDEIGDKRIYWGFNRITKKFEAWYKPASSSPYIITTSVNYCHAIRQLRERMKYERMRAKDLIAEIDTYNEKVQTDKEADAMHEVRSTMRRVASSRQIFTPPMNKRKVG